MVRIVRNGEFMMLVMVKNGSPMVIGDWLILGNNHRE